MNGDMPVNESLVFYRGYRLSQVALNYNVFIYFGGELIDRTTSKTAAMKLIDEWLNAR